MMNKNKSRLKPVEEKDRAALPKEIRLLMFFAMKGHPIKEELLEDAHNRFPELFEPVIHNQLYIE